MKLSNGPNKHLELLFRMLVLNACAFLIEHYTERV